MSWSRRHIRKNNITVANPKRWQYFEETYLHKRQYHLAYYNNCEVARVTSMQQPQVQHWHEAVTEQ